MSAFKGLERSDIYLTDYVAKKQWQVSGSQLGELGIGVAGARPGTLPYYHDPLDDKEYRPQSGSACFVPLVGTYNMRLMYESVKSLYYTSSCQDGTFKGPNEYYPQTTLTISGSRTLPDKPFDDRNPRAAVLVVITLPRDVIGMGMEMGSLNAEVDGDVFNYVEEDYCYDKVTDALTRCEDCLEPPKHPEDPYFEDYSVGTIMDFEGIVATSGSSFVGTWSQKEGWDYPSPDYGEGSIVGDIIYSHGQIIITNTFLASILEHWGLENISWKSNQPIFTEHVHCKVEDREFNRSFNETIPILVENIKKENPDSDFSEEDVTPYITSIGLYNSAGDLLAVAKLSKPIKKAPNIDMTLEVRIDLG